jgi:hypothetical protein
MYPTTQKQASQCTGIRAPWAICRAGTSFPPAGIEIQAIYRARDQQTRAANDAAAGSGAQLSSPLCLLAATPS